MAQPRSSSCTGPSGPSSQANLPAIQRFLKDTIAFFEKEDLIPVPTAGQIHASSPAELMLLPTTCALIHVVTSLVQQVSDLTTLVKDATNTLDTTPSLSELSDFSLPVTNAISNLSHRVSAAQPSAPAPPHAINRPTGPTPPPKPATI